MAIKIAINGFGRIGRPVLRRILDKHHDLKVVAINDLTDTKTLAHLLKYDSIYGRYEKEISFTENSLVVDKKEIKIFAERDPEKLPWKELEIDIVLECTGNFTDKEGAGKHIKAGARQVIISAPAKDIDIPSYLLGVNEEKFNPKTDNIVDMGSCTTNCIAPIAKIMNDNFKIIKGFMTTIHSYTNDQKILDLPHKDLRRARAAAINMIPTSTGAAKALGNIGDRRATPLLIISAKDKYDPIRREATSALGMIGDSRAVKPLIGLLRDGESEIRQASSRALGRIGDDRAVGPLIGLLRDRDLSVRREAILALGGIGDDRAVRPLIVSLRSREEKIRLASIQALGRIGDKDVIGVLRNIAWNDKSKRLRQEARRVIANLAP